MHISLDIETLSPSTEAQIIQISAVAFELNGNVQDPHELLQLEDRWLDLCIAPYYGDRDPDTEKFWLSPESRAAAELIETQPKVDIHVALERFSGFCQRWLGKRGYLWAKPPGFDCRILGGSYRMWSTPLPWHPSQEFDMRVLVWGAKKVPRVHFKVPDFTVGLTKHYALHDAVVQASTTQAAFRALGLFADDRAVEGGGTLPGVG